MCACWDESPDKRPSFTEIVFKLNEIAGEHRYSQHLSEFYRLKFGMFVFGNMIDILPRQHPAKSLFGRLCESFEFSLNCQQHKVDRSGNYFFPVFLSIKFVQATEKNYGICY